MASQMTIDLTSGITVRLTSLPRAQIDVCVFAGLGLRQRIVYAVCVPFGRLAQRDPGLFVDNAILELTDAEAAAVFAFLRLAGWKA